MIGEQAREGFVHRRAGSSDGPEWIVEGRSLVNFASCSYMGLERHPDLFAGGLAGLRDYGSNFSISRIYLDCPLYTEFEAALSEVMGRPTLVTPSTTYAHLAALPVLIGDQDLVLVDQFAHASVHMATELVDDRPIETLRHSRMDLLEERLKAAGDEFERVWYLCDGVYSMLGDYAPFAELSRLLARYPRLHLYVDDAHAMSWTGQHGRGAALSRLEHLERVVVAASLSKAFGATGGALAFPDVELRDQVRRAGGPLMFSGPINPAGLGAGLASAKLHLSPGFAELQNELHQRVAYAHAVLAEAGVRVAIESDTPVFVIHFDSIPAAQAAVRGVRDRGFFTCLSIFPAVPINKPSLRFTISRHNAFGDIRDFAAALAETIQPKAAREAGGTAAIAVG